MQTILSVTEPKLENVFLVLSSVAMIVEKEVTIPGLTSRLIPLLLEIFLFFGEDAEENCSDAK